MTNAIYVKFSDFESSDLFTMYAYDIPNTLIDEALNMLTSSSVYELVHSEIHKDWQAAINLAESTDIDVVMKHPLRVAMLVKLIQSGAIITPVEIDTFSRSCSHLEGHHRLLALKYLGYESFPCYPSGYVDVLEQELKISMD